MFKLIKYREVITSNFNALSKKNRFILFSLILLSSVVVMLSARHSSIVFSQYRGETVTKGENLKTLSDQYSEPVETIFDPNDPNFNAPKDNLDQQLHLTAILHSHMVVDGETLGDIFKQYGLPISDMYRLLKVNNMAATLGVGTSVEWEQDSTGKLTSLKIFKDVKYSNVYSWNGEDYTFSKIEKKGVIRPVLLTGKVTSNFYNSARSAGLTPKQIQDFAKKLQWKFDFAKEARVGDRFAIEIDKEFIDGNSVSAGEIGAALYQTNDEEITLVRNSDGKYYDIQGRSLERGLDRYPVHESYRVSSGFNPYRRHPVTGRIAPHNGTDFATPPGTSVYAVGDGIVVQALHHPYAGNYVIIKHGREYMTRYLHLSKILVKKGDKVSMGDKIALSGNTGRTTGPHLHYELIKNGHPVNAMKVPLPQADPIPIAERARFKEQARLTIGALRDQLI